MVSASFIETTMRLKWQVCLFVISIIFNTVTAGQDGFSDRVLELRVPTSPTSSKEDLATSESRTNAAPHLSYAWFEQRLDHSNESDSRHWLQRYFEYGGYYKPGGPIFLHIESEGGGLPAPIDLIRKGSMVQYAKGHGAYIVALEHRFYGLSRPTPDLSQRSLQFLNVDQALDDMANFIAWFKTNSGFETNKVVLFGSSYGGTLAKWFKQTYPNMTDIIVTSSAPLEARYEMPDYLDKVAEIINRTNPQCLQDLTEGFNCLENAVQGKPCGDFHQDPANIVDLFNLCEDIQPQNELDVTGLFYTLFNVFNNIVVNNIPDPRLSVSLEGVCHSLRAQEINAKSVEVKSPLERLAKVVREVTQASDLACVEFSMDKIVRYLRETTWNAPAGINGDRQFEWQRCKELGWVRGSSDSKVPFGKRISSTFHMEVCKRTFGLTENMMKQAIADMNKDFKGKTTETQCGIFVYGKDDPWSVLGFTSDEEVGPCNRVVGIEGASHAKDKGAIQGLDSNAPSVPPALKPAQKEVGKILGTWLKQGTCCEPMSTEEGNVISNSTRTTYSVVSSQSSYSSVLGSNVQNRVEVPLDPALQNSPRQSTLPFNDIDLSESRKVENIHTTVKNPDNIEIQNGVPFKEITKFLRKHEDQFFTPEAEHNHYRVRIRKTDKDQTGEQQTFSKFGIKIRMIQPAPEVNQLNKTEAWDSLPQWSKWTDFETMETINPNGTMLRAGRGSHGRRGPKDNPTQQKEELLDENVHSLHNEFGRKTDIADKGDKSLLVIKLHGKPELLPLTESQNSRNKTTRVTKRVRVKHVHRSNKNKRNETSQGNPLVEPSKIHEKEDSGDSEQYVLSPEKTLSEFGVGSHEDALFLSNRNRGHRPSPTSEPVELWPPIREDPSVNLQASNGKQENSQAEELPRKSKPLTTVDLPDDSETRTGNRKPHLIKRPLKVNSETTTTVLPFEETISPISTWTGQRFNGKPHIVRNLPTRQPKLNHQSSSDKPPPQSNKDKPLADEDDQEPENPYRPDSGSDESSGSSRGDSQEYEEGQAEISHPNKDHREIGAPDIFQEADPSGFERALSGQDRHSSNRTSAKSRHRKTSSPRHRVSKSKTPINPSSNRSHLSSQTPNQNKESGNSTSARKESHGNHVHQGNVNLKRSHNPGNQTRHQGRRQRVHHRRNHNQTSLVSKLNTPPGVSKVYVVKVRKPKKNKTDMRQEAPGKVIQQEVILTHNDFKNNNETLKISTSDYKPHQGKPNDSKNPWYLSISPEKTSNPKKTQKSSHHDYKKPPLHLVMMKDSKGKNFRIPQAALDWRSPTSPFVDMSVVTNKKESLTLTPEDVAWVNFGIPQSSSDTSTNNKPPRHRPKSI